MVSENISYLDILGGFIVLFALILSIFLGFKIILKYRTNKKIEFITIGCVFIFITNGWWGASLSFLFYFFFYIEISDYLYLILSYFLLPISLLFWIYTYSHLIYTKIKWKIVGITFLFCLLYWIIFISFLFIDSSFIAIRVSRSDSEARIIASIFMLFALGLMLITNTHFLIFSLHSTNIIIKWKGKLIYTSIILFIIGSLLDTTIPLNTLTLFITRSVLVLSSIISYIGWTMPKRIERWIMAGN